MIEMSYREFARGFCKLKDSNEEIRVVGRGGVVIGTWISGMSDNVGHSEESEEVEVVGQRKEMSDIGLSDKREKFAELKKMFEGGAKVHYAKEEEVEAVKCIKCKKNDAVWAGEIWEDGEEIKVSLCDFCIKGVQNKRSFKKI